MANIRMTLLDLLNKDEQGADAVAPAPKTHRLGRS